MPRALLLLVISLLGVGGPALAQSHFKDAIKGAVKGSTLEEVIAWSDAQFAKKATVGRYVRWGGTILIGSALVYTALDWFYNELKRQTGTPLDQWYFWTPQLAAFCRDPFFYDENNKAYYCNQVVVLSRSCEQAGLYSLCPVRAMRLSCASMPVQIRLWCTRLMVLGVVLTGALAGEYLPLCGRLSALRCLSI